jgi:hypothetical protein
MPCDLLQRMLSYQSDRKLSHDQSSIATAVVTTQMKSPDLALVQHLRFGLA